MECGDQYDNNMPLVMAKNTGRQEMESVVSKRLNKLKVELELMIAWSCLLHTLEELSKLCGGREAMEDTSRSFFCCW